MQKGNEGYIGRVPSKWKVAVHNQEDGSGTVAVESAQ